MQRATSTLLIGSKLYIIPGTRRYTVWKI